jgi:hypothetical protein
MRGRAALVALAFAACDPPGSSPSPAPIAGGPPPASSVVPEPGGSLEPGPFQSAAPLPRAGGTTPDAAPPPEPFAHADSLSADTAPTKSELAGVLLEARWVWPKPPVGLPDASEEALARARKKVALDHVISLASDGKLRIAFRSTALPFPGGTELLARSDRYGALLVWPNAPQYRIVVPGALRAAIEDRRMDVLPFAKAKMTAAGEGTRLGVAVRKVELTSSFGTLALELARIDEAGAGGALVCRFLVELAGIDPAAPVCRSEAPEVPLVASYRWLAHPESTEAARFEVLTLSARDKDVSYISVPPSGVRSRSEGLPGPSSVTLLSDEELAALRTKDAPAGPPKADGPKAGLLARNSGTRTLYLVIDGIAVAYVAPRGQVRLEALRPGRYHVQWRTLLGEEMTAFEELTLPATFEYHSNYPGTEAQRTDSK